MKCRKHYIKAGIWAERTLVIILSVMRRRLKEELRDFIGSKDIDESIEWLMTWPRNED